MKTIILIPSRMAATRYPGKPLLKIDGRSIISQVYKRALETNIGEVYVATEDQEIFDDVIEAAGFVFMDRSCYLIEFKKVISSFRALSKDSKLRILKLLSLEKSPVHPITLIISLNGDKIFPLIPKLPSSVHKSILLSGS